MPDRRVKEKTKRNKNEYVRLEKRAISVDVRRTIRVLRVHKCVRDAVGFINEPVEWAFSGCLRWLYTYIRFRTTRNADLHKN